MRDEHTVECPPSVQGVVAVEVEGVMEPCAGHDEQEERAQCLCIALSIKAGVKGKNPNAPVRRTVPVSESASQTWAFRGRVYVLVVGKRRKVKRKECAGA